MKKMRDEQRSAVYAWERAVNEHLKLRMFKNAGMNLDEAREYAHLVWAREHKFYEAKKRPPRIERAHMGQRAALSFGGRITLPVWSRNPWLILHELAHELTDSKEYDAYPAHGGRFVATLIGLAARHLGVDPEFLMEQALARGLRVTDRWLGVAPPQRLYHQVFSALPGTPMDIAIRINEKRDTPVNYKQVHGASLALIKKGLARWKGRKLVRA